MVYLTRGWLTSLRSGAAARAAGGGGAACLRRRSFADTVGCEQVLGMD